MHPTLCSIATQYGEDVAIHQYNDKKLISSVRYLLFFICVIFQLSFCHNIDVVFKKSKHKYGDCLEH